MDLKAKVEALEAVDKKIVAIEIKTAASENYGNQVAKTIGRRG